MIRNQIRYVHYEEALDNLVQQHDYPTIHAALKDIKDLLQLKERTDVEFGSQHQSELEDDNTIKWYQLGQLIDHSKNHVSWYDYL